MGTASRERAFRTLFETEVAYVWKTLRRLGVREADVEDVAHDVFVTVYRRYDELDPARPVRPWLFGVAFRTAAGHRRLARNQREIADDSTHDAPDPTLRADDALVQRDAQQLVLEALESLDLEKRAVFVMHDLDELPMREIALVLDIPVNTAYSRLRLAREQFRAAVQRLRLRRGAP